jgi:hypothetical protein
VRKRKPYVLKNAKILPEVEKRPRKKITAQITGKLTIALAN